MDFLNASDAKREFGDLPIKAQSSPLAIKKNDKQVAVVMSAAEYVRLQVMKEQGALQQGLITHFPCSVRLTAEKWELISNYNLKKYYEKINPKLNR